MGQYYKVITKRNGKFKMYNRDVDGEYTMAKLMEHSWWRNDFCCAFAETIVDKPTKVCWCGDYAEEDECEALGFKYEQVWGNRKGCGVKKSNFEMSSVKYLVNNDKGLYVDLQKYYEKSMCKEEYEGKNYEYCIFPISILTALGNDRGGGDYHKECATCYELVGTWAFDEIFLTNKEPPAHFKELEVYFKEN